MDEQETIVKQYLIFKGYNDRDIQYEPDGNIPPDFLVNKSIAIEVRRLNQNYENNGSFMGLEVDSIPLTQSINSLFEKFNNRYIDKSYFVYLRFKRPQQKLKITKKEIHKALSDFADNPKDTKIEIKLNTNLSLLFFPASPRDGKFFLLAGYTDRDSGGWVLSEMKRNIQLCSDEKINKIRDVRSKYKVWWLALVDHISFGFDRDEQTIEGTLNSKELGWDKIVLINPLNPEEAYEI